MKIILGAGGVTRAGWLATEQHQLDLMQPGTFAAIGLLPGTVDAFLAEHVWEHIDADQGQAAAALCYEYLRPGGHLRLAVPDGLHPDPDYIEWVRPGGSGPGCDSHHVLYNHRSLSVVLTGAGFEVRLLEYWDEAGTFRCYRWDADDGFVERSALHDPRNEHGLHYTSLMMDGVK